MPLKLVEEDLDLVLTLFYVCICFHVHEYDAVQSMRRHPINRSRHILEGRCDVMGLPASYPYRHSVLLYRIVTSSGGCTRVV